MLKKWIVGDSDPLPFFREIGLSALVSSILLRRGVTTAAEAGAFLNPTVAQFRPPQTLAGMDSSVRRVRRALEAREKILIYGDYDADGVTGSSILYLALRGLGADVGVFIPDRVQDGYGLKRSALERALAKDTGLVITVDNGITGRAEIDFLSQKGIDCIVVDHHEVKGEKPAAFAIIDGAPLSDPQAGPPADGDLAACGLAFKFAWGLCGSLEKASEHLDLAAIGTVADMAPLRGENRLIVRLGLEQAARTKKPGLRALLELLDIRGVPTSEETAFQIAPRLNAAGRMGSAQEAVRMLVTDNATEAENLAGILDRCNEQRQRLEKEAYREALASVGAEHHFGRDPVLVVSSDRWHEGVVGIVATRLVEKYHRPAFAISLKNGIGKGSGRSIPDFLLFETMMKCPDVFESFGGHQAACGLVIKESNIPDFKKAINVLAKASLSPEQLQPKLRVDAELPLGGLDEKLMEELDRLEPFGIGNPRPLFVARGVRMKGPVKSFGKSGSTVWVEDAENGRAAEAVSYRQRLEFREGELFDLVYSPSLRKKDGAVSILLRVEDADVAQAA